MQMCEKHLQLAKEINDFAYSYFQDHKELSEVQKRCLINRFYYAAFNKILSENKKLRESTGSQKHSQALKLLKNDDYVTFKKLRYLREWADYDVRESNQALNIPNIARLVYKFINQKNIQFN